MGFGVLGHCSAVGTFVGEVWLIWVFAGEHQCWTVVASLVTPALGSSYHGHLPSWHLLVILFCVLATDPVLIRTVPHWKEN